jgi:hypothetical protein
MSAIDDVLVMLKAGAAVARALGVGEGEIQGAITPAEAAEIDLEVDAAEEAKLAAIAARGKGGG